MSMKIVLSIIALSFLTACAPPLDTGPMRPSVGIVKQIATHPALERNIKVGEVVVPNEYKQSDIGTLDSAGLKSVIEDALLISDYLPRADDEARYTLNATLVKLSTPAFGFDLDASCDITYNLVRDSDQTVILQETIKQGYLAPFSEAFNATQRARGARSKAIRENLTQLLRVLGNVDLPKKGKKK